MESSLLPGVCVLSGPAATTTNCVHALVALGLKPVESDGAGLPSHTDPLTAYAAGAPNSGHTPGTSHPETLAFTVQDGDHEHCENCEHVGSVEERPNPLAEHVGSDYEHDPTIAFLAVACDDPDLIARTIEPTAWIVRMIVAPVERGGDDAGMVLA